MSAFSSSRGIMYAEPPKRTPSGDEADAETSASEPAPADD